MDPRQSQEQNTIRDLFPDLPEDQLKEVEQTLHGYLGVLWRIYERLLRERPEIFDNNTHPS
jgi:hypothetical protein